MTQWEWATGNRALIVSQSHFGFDAHRHQFLHEQLEGIRDLQLGDVSRCFTVLAAASVSQKATLLEWEWIE